MASSPTERQRRILVMGRAGSGKSTVAARLGEALGIPVVHLDSLFWDANWQPVGWTSSGHLEASEAAADEWIMDGNYMTSPGFGTRIGRAQLVLVAEAPLHVCLWRVIRRSLFSARASRRDRGAEGGALPKSVACRRPTGVE